MGTIAERDEFSTGGLRGLVEYSKQQAVLIHRGVVRLPEFVARAARNRNSTLIEAQDEKWRLGRGLTRGCVADKSVIDALSYDYDARVFYDLVTRLRANERGLVGIGAGRIAEFPDPLIYIAQALYGTPHSPSFLLGFEQNREAYVQALAHYAVALPPEFPLFLRHETVTPLNIVRLLQGFEHDVAVLSVDIDGFDCPVIEAVLQVARPCVLSLEVNLDFPPPLCFARHFSGSEVAFWDTWGTNALKPSYGCSLSYMVRMLQRYDYFLYHMFGSEAVFLRKDLWHAAMRERFPDEVDWAEGPKLLDEIACYRQGVKWGGFPLAFVYEWAWDLEPHEALRRVWGNVTATDALLGHSTDPFTLDLLR